MIKKEMKGEESLESKPSVGLALSKRRQDLGYEIAQVASKLKLRTVQIEALEADNYSFFPERAYYAGFLKVYADFLHFNLEPFQAWESTEKKELVSRFVAPGQKNKAHLPELRPLPSMSKKTIPFWIFFVAGLILTIVAYIGWYQVTRPPSQVPLPEQVREESLEEAIPPVMASHEEMPAEETVSPALPQESKAVDPEAGKQMEETHLSVAAEKTDSKTSPEISKEKRQIMLVALKDEVPIEITTEAGKSVFSGSLEKDKEWFSPTSGGKYFISVNDASAIGIRTKDGHYHALGKKGKMLRNFDLSRLN